MGYPKHPEIATKEIIELYDSGLTIRETAKKLGVSDGCVAGRLRVAGHKNRKGGPRKGAPAWNAGKPYHQIRGKRNPRWKGGVTDLNQQIRHCLKMKQWKKTILLRDDFTCVLCLKRGGNKQVDHHPVRFAQIIVDERIVSVDGISETSLLWSLDNGRTLCSECHRLTFTTKIPANKVQD
jgi:5-methylcytosine-specific restriction endonuclease McrA